MSQLLDLLDLIVRFIEWLTSRSEKPLPPAESDSPSARDSAPRS